MKILFFALLLCTALSFPFAVFGQTQTDTIYFETSGEDAYINGASASTNYGSDTSLWVYYDYGSPTQGYYSYLKADYSTIPTNAVVVNASLNMYALSVNNDAEHALHIYRITSSWDESTLTWSSNPSTTATYRANVSNDDCSNIGWQSFDIDLITQYQIEFPNENYGIRINQQNSTGTTDKGVKFASTEHANSAYRPYMIIEYYIPETDTIYLENTKDATVYSGQNSTNYGQDTTLSVEWSNSGGWYATRSFVYADLSGIPENAIVTNADLHMYSLEVFNDGSHPLYVERVTGGNWYEDTITWQNQPTVQTTYRSSITHAMTDDTGWQVMPIDMLAQAAVWSPAKNYGWRLSLQSESDTLNKGCVYASGEHSSGGFRPFVVVEHVMPIEIEGGYVRHCTNGNSDGAISDITVSGGCGLYKAYAWRKYTNGSYAGVETGTDISMVDVASLSPGLYLLYVTDWRGVVGHKFFLVGEEGATTSVQFTGVSGSYIEDSFVTYIKSTGDSTNIGGSVTTVGCHTSTYNSRSFVSYNVDWDPSLEFTSCRQAFRNKGSCYQTTTSDNDAWISRVTGAWGEQYVTWGTRPGVTTEDRVYIPTTTTNGYEQRNDTIDILAFVPYWQEHPDENFGFELSLNTYNQPTLAQRDYSSTDYIGHNLMVSFTVRPKIETFYYDSLGTGDILINAPAAELPYTYLISTIDTLPILDSIWQDLNEIITLDSLRFFQGKSNTRNYTFSNLPIDQYYVGVYDNNGTKIYDGQVYLKPPLKLKDTVDADIVGDTLKVNSPTGSATVIYYGEVSNTDPGGFECKVVSLAGEVLVGFNKWTDGEVTADGDYEYGIKIMTSGVARFLKEGTTIGSFTVSVDDVLRLVNENGVVNLYKNGVLIETETIDPGHRNTWKMEVLMKASASKIVFKPWGSIKPKNSYLLTYADCGSDLGSLTVYPTSFFGYSLASFSLVNAITSTLYESETMAGVPITLTDIPVGIYNLTSIYSNGVVSLPAVTHQLYIGYPIEWINEFNIAEVPLNNIKVSPPSTTVTSTAESANSIEGSVDYWEKFDPVFSTGYSLGEFRLDELNGTSGELRVLFAQVWGVKVMFVLSESGAEIIEPGLPYTPLYIGGNPVGIYMPAATPIVLTSTSGVMEILYQNNLLVDFNTTISADLITVAHLNGNAGMSNTIASYCYAVNKYIAKTKPYQDGSYYPAKQHILEFQYTGEYNTSDLIYSLTDESGDEILSTSYSISVMGGSGSGKTNADNRYILNMASLNSGYYLLTITNVKGEKHYIRIKN